MEQEQRASSDAEKLDNLDILLRLRATVTEDTTRKIKEDLLPRVQSEVDRVIKESNLVKDVATQATGNSLRRVATIASAIAVFAGYLGYQSVSSLFDSAAKTAAENAARAQIADVKDQISAARTDLQKTRDEIREDSITSKKNIEETSKQMNFQLELINQLIKREFAGLSEMRQQDDERINAIRKQIVDMEQSASRVLGEMRSANQQLVEDGKKGIERDLTLLVQKLTKQLEEEIDRRRGEIEIAKVTALREINKSKELIDAPSAGVEKKSADETSTQEEQERANYIKGLEILDAKRYTDLLRSAREFAAARDVDAVRLVLDPIFMLSEKFSHEDRTSATTILVDLPISPDEQRNALLESIVGAARVGDVDMFHIAYDRVKENFLFRMQGDNLISMSEVLISAGGAEKFLNSVPRDDALNTFTSRGLFNIMSLLKIAYKKGWVDLQTIDEVSARALQENEEKPFVKNGLDYVEASLVVNQVCLEPILPSTQAARELRRLYEIDFGKSDPFDVKARIASCLSKVEPRKQA